TQSSVPAPTAASKSAARRDMARPQWNHHEQPRGRWRMTAVDGVGDEARAALVRAELDRIVSSELFTRSARLSAFLRFIVNRTLAGEGESLKEHVIAVDLYGKPGDFDTAADPIVRIDARRLRDKLREYYADALASGVVISVPKGSYTPAFRFAAEE